MNRALDSEPKAGRRSNAWCETGQRRRYPSCRPISWLFFRRSELSGPEQFCEEPTSGFSGDCPVGLTRAIGQKPCAKLRSVLTSTRSRHRALGWRLRVEVPPTSRFGAGEAANHPCRPNRTVAATWLLPLPPLNPHWPNAFSATCSTALVVMSRDNSLKQATVLTTASVRNRKRINK